MNQYQNAWTFEISGTTLKMSGVIDDRTDFSKIPAINGPTVTIDLGNVPIVNSVWVKKWLTFIRTLSDKKIVIKNCKFPIVELANIIPDVFPKNCSVESFEIPYSCGSCEEETYIFALTKDFREHPSQFEETACRACGKIADIDAVLASFTAVLKS